MGARDGRAARDEPGPAAREASNVRAIRIDEMGGPEVLRVGEAAAPGHPGPREVQIAVRAAGLNFADTMFVRGKYFIRPKLPDIPGMEAAGDVVAVGAEVEGLRIGDRVMALGARAFAERMNASAVSTYLVPSGLPHEKAAALPIQGLTAHHLLFLMARLAPGERVLVHAAGGGVGSIAVQLAKRHGAVVVASAAPDKHDRLRALGADFTVDSRGDLLSQIKSSVGEVDVVLEMIGGTESYKRSFACLRALGRMIVFGAASGDTRGTFEPVGLMGKNLTIAGYYLTPLLARREMCAGPLAAMAEQASTGALRIDTTAFPIDEARAAFEALEGRSSVGKVVLVF